MTIFKYKFEQHWVNGGVHGIKMPFGAKILSAQLQHNEIEIWVQIPDPDANYEERQVMVIGTGIDWPSDAGDLDFVDTIQVGMFVFHVFADGKVA